MQFTFERQVGPGLYFINEIQDEDIVFITPANLSRCVVVGGCLRPA